jgi:hypothetical protein
LIDKDFAGCRKISVAFPPLFSGQLQRPVYIAKVSGLLFKLGEKQIIEGTLDLPFVANRKWMIVHFKSD